MWKKVLIIVILFVNNDCSSHPQIFMSVPVDSYEPIQSPDFDTKLLETFTIGSCIFALNRLCPDPDIRFYLFSKMHREIPEEIRISIDQNISNLRQTAYNPSLPSKIIVHGYNSNMNLPALAEIRKQYLNSPEDLNVFVVDWSPLSQGPCYPAAVYNSRHAGECASLLIERLRETGNVNIHVIGFSLGAHVTNFMAVAVRPYKIPRITGLDPAMPGFITVGLDDKLDSSDAEFVDVLHTNAFIQGKAEESGHVDFYLNGGSLQPGCWVENRYFACHHHRAPIYFAESVNSAKGFWGWPCPSYWDYLFNGCPPAEPQIVMGDHVNNTARGVYLVITDSVTPYAVGKFTGPTIEILLKSEYYRLAILNKYKVEIGNQMEEDEMFDELYQNYAKNDKFHNEMAKISKIQHVLENDFYDYLLSNKETVSGSL